MSEIETDVVSALEANRLESEQTLAAMEPLRARMDMLMTQHDMLLTEKYSLPEFASVDFGSDPEALVTLTVDSIKNEKAAEVRAAWIHSFAPELTDSGQYVPDVYAPIGRIGLAEDSEVTDELEAAVLAFSRAVALGRDEVGLVVLTNVMAEGNLLLVVRSDGYARIVLSRLYYADTEILAGLASLRDALEYIATYLPTTGFDPAAEDIFNFTDKD